MAYNFDAASSQYLSTPSTPITAVPVSISVQVQASSLAAFQSLTAIGRVGFIDRWQLGVSNTGFAQAATAETGLGSIGADSPTGVISTNVNYSLVAVYENNSSRKIYVNGVLRGTNTATRTPSSVDIITIGARYNPTLGLYARGRIAEVAIWSTALSADEIVSLAKGFSPRRVCPQSLKFYAPTVREAIDVCDGLALTNNNGATVTNHPRVY